MFFLNLNLIEFLGLLGGLGGIITALYLLDRGKRRKVVSTLRFWTAGFTPTEQRSRKRMREPWSLILQLVSLLLLLLAVAQLEWGTRPHRGRDHVVLLDVSSWSAAKSNGESVLDAEKRLATEYANALPARDRVMLVRAGALMEPVTSFSANREAVLNAIASSSSGFSVLNADAALSFAQQAQSWSGGQNGEIVYAGPGRIGEGSARTDASAPNLRVLSVPVDPNNCGIASIGVRHSEDDPNGWQATVAVRNYSPAARMIQLKTSFAGTRFAPRTLTLAPNSEEFAEYSFSTTVSGQLVAAIDGNDSLSQDDSAVLALPTNGPLKVVAYTSRPEVLRPLLEANRRLSVTYSTAAAYKPSVRAEITIVDGFSPSALPQGSSLFINASEAGSPIPVKATAEQAVISGWHTEGILGAGLHARDLRLPRAKIFQLFDGDVPVAAAAEGPVIVARSAGRGYQKLVAIGFDPLSGALRYEVTTPLLFANLIRWLAPESFQVTELTANHVGQASVALDRSEQTENRIRVTDENGWSIPFTVHHGAVQLFTDRPGIVHVSSGERERILSLTLPEVGPALWKPGAQVASGIPRPSRGLPDAMELWKLLALLGGLGLVVEYFLYGRRRSVWKRRIAARRFASPERELAAK